mmetsp:Transcript_4966/g.12217  ORF Transcript_4966/g.12217 Transcript_4966/m.12217 type:complete len:89 (-) Transcript_4966:1083-1349(-)
MHAAWFNSPRLVAVKLLEPFTREAVVTCSAHGQLQIAGIVKKPPVCANVAPQARLRYCSGRHQLLSLGLRMAKVEVSRGGRRIAPRLI